MPTQKLTYTDAMYKNVQKNTVVVDTRTFVDKIVVVVMLVNWR